MFNSKFETIACGGNLRTHIKSKRGESFKILNILGKGISGTVYHVKSEKDGNEYAIKEMKMVEFKRKEKELEREREQKIKYCDHKNIVKFSDSWTEDESETLYMQMELCEKDNLAIWLRKNKNHSERRSKIFEILTQIVDAVKHIHSVGLIHRDLKVNWKFCVERNYSRNYRQIN